MKSFFAIKRNFSPRLFIRLFSAPKLGTPTCVSPKNERKLFSLLKRLRCHPPLFVHNFTVHVYRVRLLLVPKVSKAEAKQFSFETICCRRYEQKLNNYDASAIFKLLQALLNIEHAENFLL